jgi:hypothetical protein
MMPTLNCQREFGINKGMNDLMGLMQPVVETEADLFGLRNIQKNTYLR